MAPGKGLLADCSVRLRLASAKTAGAVGRRERGWGCGFLQGAGDADEVGMGEDGKAGGEVVEHVHDGGVDGDVHATLVLGADVVEATFDELPTGGFEQVDGVKAVVVGDLGDVLPVASRYVHAVSVGAGSGVVKSRSQAARPWP